MRLKLNLKCHPNGKLSINYHYALQAVIYKVLQQSDPEFSAWLHNKGYEAFGEKRFKLFTFGDLTGLYDLDSINQTIQFKTDTIEWQLSFCVDAAVEKFITGLFQNQKLTVITPNGRIDFTVQGVEIIEPPSVFKNVQDGETTSIIFRTIMPICISEKRESQKYAQYLNPDEENYKDLFFGNLESKCKAALGHIPLPSALDFKVLRCGNKRGLETLKANLEQPIKTIGYNYRFQLTAPVEWLRIGYESGFGKSNSSGFGMCEVLSA
jgi:CRISPR-associated endoribonuclease Cas6